MSTITMQFDSQMNVTDFDFSQASQLPNSGLQEFHGIQESFGQRLATDLSPYLRRQFSITLKEVQQTTWERYCSRFTEPSCFLVASLRPHMGHGVVQLTSSLTFSILEILLGGKAESTAGASRELTAIERRLLKGVFRSTLQHLRDAWPADAPGFELESVIASPAATAVFSPLDVIVLAEFLVLAEGVEGQILVAVPARLAKPRRQESDTEVAPQPVLRHPGEEMLILRRIRPGKVRVELALTQATIKIRDLVALRPGDVLDLAQPVSSTVTMSVNGVEAFNGEVIPVGRQRAFAVHAVGKRKVLSLSPS